MTFEEFERASKRDLKSQANQCFNDLGNSLHPREAKLLEAQFYMQELDRRHDSWISWRDFILEAIVIALIGWEICMGYKQDDVLTKLQESAAATAMTLRTLQAIVTAVAIDLVANPDHNTIIITNRGNTNLEIWGFKLNTEPDVFYEKPVMLMHGGSDYITASQFYNSISKTVKHDGSESRIPIAIDLRSDDKTEYVATCQLVVFWEHDRVQYHSQTTTVNAQTWSTKAHGGPLITP